MAVATFEIGFTRFLDRSGEVVQPLPAFASEAKALIPLYRSMTRLRMFDAKAVALQRTGRLGTYAAALGEEAVTIGLASAMAADDVLVPAFRDQGAQLWRGVGLVDILAYWGGDERGSVAGPSEDFPVCVPIGTHFPHAVGVALAIKLRRQSRAVVCIGGDGATSKGDVYEAMNMAGLWQLPVVFVVSNNQWAISVPRQRQTAAATLAQKAIAAGIPGEQVDGNDVIAVRHAVDEALAAARAGRGPRLIEAVTYRLGDHTTSDDATRYRDDATVSTHWAEEPLVRLRRYLTAQGVWTKEDEEAMQVALAAEIEKAVADYLALPPPAPQDMFDHLFAVLPADLKAQRDTLAEEEALHA